MTPVAVTIDVPEIRVHGMLFVNCSVETGSENYRQEGTPCTTAVPSSC